MSGSLKSRISGSFLQVSRTTFEWYIIVVRLTQNWLICREPLPLNRKVNFLPKLLGMSFCGQWEVGQLDSTSRLSKGELSARARGVGTCLAFGQPPA
jgi:hypothetical protein